MASNHVRWVGNLNGAKEPLIMPGLFQAGATQAIKQGELIEFTADTNSKWCPMDSDFDGAGNMAIAAEEVKSGDRAGYYKIYIPRPGDVWEFPLATAAASVIGADVFWSDSETVKATGTNPLGYVVGFEHYPDYQGHLTDDAAGDAGVTVRSTSYVRFTMDLASSPYANYVK